MPELLEAGELPGYPGPSNVRVGFVADLCKQPLDDEGPPMQWSCLGLHAWRSSYPTVIPADRLRQMAVGPFRYKTPPTLLRRQLPIWGRDDGIDRTGDPRCGEAV